MQCPGLGAGSGDHTPSSCIECGAQSRAARPRPLLPPAVSVRSQIDVCLYICVSPAVSFSSVGRHPTNYIYICVSVSYTCPSACPISIPPPPPLYCNASSLLIHVYYLLMNRQHCDRVVQDEGTAVVLVVWCVVCMVCVPLPSTSWVSSISHCQCDCLHHTSPCICWTNQTGQWWADHGWSGWHPGWGMWALWVL